MAYMESAFSKLKGGSYSHCTGQAKNQNSVLSDMNSKLSELRKKYNELQADLEVSKSVTETTKNHIIVLEYKYVNVWKYLGYHLTLRLAS